MGFLYWRAMLNRWDCVWLKSVNRWHWTTLNQAWSLVVKFSFFWCFHFKLIRHNFIPSVHVLIFGHLHQTTWSAPLEKSFSQHCFIVSIHYHYQFWNSIHSHRIIDWTMTISLSLHWSIAFRRHLCHHCRMHCKLHLNIEIRMDFMNWYVIKRQDWPPTSHISFEMYQKNHQLFLYRLYHHFSPLLFIFCPTYCDTPTRSCFSTANNTNNQRPIFSQQFSGLQLYYIPNNSRYILHQLLQLLL